MYLLLGILKTQVYVKVSKKILIIVWLDTHVVDALLHNCLVSGYNLFYFLYSNSENIKHNFLSPTFALPMKEQTIMKDSTHIYDVN